MKKHLLLLVCLFSVVISLAQDKIYTRSQNNPIVGEVTEVGLAEVKYKPVDNPLPIVTLDRNEVIKIVYKNGQVLNLNDGVQDKIYTKLQKNPIEGEVTEISVNEVKYKPLGRPFPVVTIDKQDVIKVVYKNGQVFMISNPLQDYTVYQDQHKWNLKLNLLSPLLGHTQLFLERSKKPGRSIEYELNLIGLGKDQALQNDFLSGDVKYEARGAGVGIGLKFLRLPDYVNGQVRLRHIMQGSYIKPAISLDVYSRNFIASRQGGGFVTERKTVFAIHPHITFGRQWIMDNTVSIELYGLVGYAIDNVRANEKSLVDDTGQFPTYIPNLPFNGFGYTRFQKDDFGLTLGLGLRIGFLFDWKKEK
jgi:hypothetical protein